MFKFSHEDSCCFGSHNDVVVILFHHCHLRGPLLVNIFWTHKNCLWQSVLVLAFGSPKIINFLASVPFFFVDLLVPPFLGR